jgi:hypothetical protein
VNCPGGIFRLDQGKLITIPSLPDAADRQAYEAHVKTQARPVSQYTSGSLRCCRGRLGQEPGAKKILEVL